LLAFQSERSLCELISTRIRFVRLRQIGAQGVLEGRVETTRTQQAGQHWLAEVRDEAQPYTARPQLA
jgi:hypothetical protein